MIIESYFVVHRPFLQTDVTMDATLHSLAADGVWSTQAKVDRG
jgi:hypothetical protein